MCKVCDKADFLIEMMEQWMPIAEMRELLRAEWNRDSDEHTPEERAQANELLDKNDYFVLYTMIATIASRWAIKGNIGPNTFFSAIHEVAMYQYSKDMIRRGLAMTGQIDPDEALRHKLKDFES